jgi:ABC-2 type transport system ATP-binding protein
MDEPTIGLDPHQILAIRRLIDSLRGRLTVLLSSHILPEIELCCDRVMIINQGRLVAAGTSASLRREFLPQSEWRVRLQGDLAAFEQMLVAAGPPLQLKTRGPVEADGFAEVRLEGPSGRPELAEKLLAETLRRGQWRVREWAHVEPGLEEIFLAATNHRLEDSPVALGRAGPAGE